MQPYFWWFAICVLLFLQYSIAFLILTHLQSAIYSLFLHAPLIDYLSMFMQQYCHGEVQFFHGYVLSNVWCSKSIFWGFQNPRLKGHTSESFPWKMYALSLHHCIQQKAGSMLQSLHLNMSKDKKESKRTLDSVSRGIHGYFQTLLHLIECA